MVSANRIQYLINNRSCTITVCYLFDVMVKQLNAAEVLLVNSITRTRIADNGVRNFAVLRVKSLEVVYIENKVLKKWQTSLL